MNHLMPKKRTQKPKVNIEAKVASPLNNHASQMFVLVGSTLLILAILAGLS